MQTPKPFFVQTVAGSLCAEYDTMAQAEASAKDRNARAESLGIEARYQALAR